MSEGLRQTSMINEEDVDFESMNYGKATEFITADPSLVRILLYTLHKKCTWVSELAFRFNIPYDEMQRKVQLLLNLGFLAKIIITDNKPDPRLDIRMQELWDLHISGFEAFNRRLFVTLATPDMGGAISVEQFIKFLEWRCWMLKETKWMNEVKAW
jgi:hypothetical protein